MLSVFHRVENIMGKAENSGKELNLSCKKESVAIIYAMILFILICLPAFSPFLTILYPSIRKLQFLSDMQFVI